MKLPIFLKTRWHDYASYSNWNWWLRLLWFFFTGLILQYSGRWFVHLWVFILAHSLTLGFIVAGICKIFLHCHLFCFVLHSCFNFRLQVRKVFLVCKLVHQIWSVCNLLLNVSTLWLSILCVAAIGGHQTKEHLPTLTYLSLFFFNVKNIFFIFYISVYQISHVGHGGADLGSSGGLAVS